MKKLDILLGIKGCAYSKNGQYIYYLIRKKIIRYTLREKFDYHTAIESSKKEM